MVKVRMSRLEQFYILKSCVFEKKKKEKKMLFPNRNNKPKWQISINTERK